MNSDRRNVVLNSVLRPATGVLLVAVILVVWSAWPWLMQKYVYVASPDDVVGSMEKRGQLGDSFGAFTALFTAVGLIGVAGTYLLQRQQMQEQNQQFFLQQQREAVQHRSDVEQTLLQQKIDRFYSHLDWWQQAAREIEYVGVDESGDKVCRGPHALCKMENDFLGELCKTPGRWHGWFQPTYGPRGEMDDHILGCYMGPQRLQLSPVEEFSVESLTHMVPEIFMRFYEERVGAIMGHIFRMQSELVKYVWRERMANNFTEEIEHRLIGSYKALLTDPDMHLLLYYGLSGIDDEFRDLIKRYALLDWLCKKPRVFVCHRIPELVEYFPELRHPTVN